MEEKVEKVVEEITQESTEQVDESKFDSAGDDSVIKVDLSAPPQEKVETEVVAEKKTEEAVTEVTEETDVQPEAETQETPVLEEITEEEVEEEVEEEEEVAEATGKPLPENIQKLMDFMEDTGGDLNDYVTLNQDYSKLDDQNLLYEYYKQTKPHLNNEEINFLIEDTFSYDEDMDDDRDIRRKKLALKEQVADAKSHLDGQKSKYYEEIKAGSKLTGEQQKAIDFFNRYTKESKESDKHATLQAKTFSKKTDEVFNDKFKGFEYNIGDKKFRFNINNVDSVKMDQSSISNFVGKFLDKNSVIQDARSYHKSLFTANNADAVASHFYEQGKTDALKHSIASSKNIDMSPRQANKEVQVGGIKVRALGEDSYDFKFKIKNKNK